MDLSTATAHASALDEAEANAIGIGQDAEGHEGQGFNGALNNNHIQATAKATANAHAFAHAIGIAQDAEGTGAFVPHGVTVTGTSSPTTSLVHGARKHGHLHGDVSIPSSVLTGLTTQVASGLAAGLTS